LRKVVCRSLAEVPREELLELVELLEELDVALGALALPATCGAATLGVNP
jgi:hypothetical protein